MAQPRWGKGGLIIDLGWSDCDPLHFIQTDLIIAPVIQAGGARTLMIRHLLRDL